MSKKMRTKILTALVILAVALPCLIIGGLATRILLVVVSALAAYEVASLKDNKADWLLTLLNFAVITVLTEVSDIYYPAVTAIWLVIIFTIGLLDQKENVDHIAFTFVITMLVSLAMRCLRAIYADNEMGALVFLFVLAACYLTDTFAYFFGVFFGKHKMIPRVSPNKTWEGAVGGYCSSALISFIYGYFLCKNLPIGLVLTASLLLPATAQIGDLSFSLIKRRFGIKDFGNIFPEHGGVLDRIDSLIFCLMLFNALLIIWRVV